MAAKWQHVFKKYDEFAVRMRVFAQVFDKYDDFAVEPVGLAGWLACLAGWLAGN